MSHVVASDVLKELLDDGGGPGVGGVRSDGFEHGGVTGELFGSRHLQGKDEGNGRDEEGSASGDLRAPPKRLLRRDRKRDKKDKSGESIRTVRPWLIASATPRTSWGLMSSAEVNELAVPKNSERTRGALLVFSWQRMYSIEVAE